MDTPTDVGTTESAWRRGWKDAKRGWTDWRFVIADMVALPLLAVFVSFPIAIGVAALSLSAVWVGATASAPVRQRNEARQALALSQQELAALNEADGRPILAASQLHIRSLEHDFGEPGKRGYPQPKTDATRLLRIHVLLTPTNGLQVESVELEVQGKRIPSTWESNEVSSVPSGQYIYFEVPPDVTPGDHQVTLVALADGTPWRSRRFSLTFPAISDG